MKAITPSGKATAYKTAMAQPVRSASLLSVAITHSGNTYTFREGEILNAQKVEDIDPLSRRLPTQTFTVTVADPTHSFDPMNPTGKWQAEKGDKMVVKFGLNLAGTESWADADYYYLTGKPDANTGSVTFTGEGRIATLTKEWWKDYTSVNYATAVDGILTDAGITSGERNLDTLALNQRIGIASESKPCTTAEALQRFAHASGMALYSRGDKVCMKRWFEPATPPDYSQIVIPLEDILLNGDTVAKTEEVSTLRVTGYQQVLSSETQTIWEGDVYQGSSTGVRSFQFDYGGEPFWDIARTVTGGATVALETLAQYRAELVLSGAGTAHVVITGSPVEVVTVQMDVTIGGAGGAVEEINNPLLGFTAQTAVPRDWLIQDYTYYLAKRVTHAVRHRGTDLIEAGDPVTLTTERGTVNGLVLAVRTDYNGAISSTLTIKEMS